MTGDVQDCCGNRASHARPGCRARLGAGGDDSDSPEALRTYAQQTSFKYVIMPERDATATAFGVKSYPSHMILDGSSNVVWMAGSEPDPIERLRAMIFRILAGVR